MKSKKGSEQVALREVLRRVNQLGDFMFDAVATGASDRGTSGDYPMHKVAIWGDVESAEVLLAHGADVNATGEDGDTPLHRALMAGTNRAEMVKFLLSRGANADLPNRYGHTPRNQAKDSDDPQIVCAMKSQGDPRSR